MAQIRRDDAAYDRMAKSPVNPGRSASPSASRINEQFKTFVASPDLAPKSRGESYCKPSLDAVMSQAQLENKVAGYLRDSLALEDYWQKPITASNYRPRWTEWPGTQNSPKSSGNRLRLLETIRLLSPSVWPGQY